MFDHLDDPDGFRPTDDFRAAVHRRGRHLRRRHRLGVMSTTVVGCLVLTVGGLAVAADRRLDEVDRVEIGPADSGEEHTFDEPFNVLVVGTDGRPGVDGSRSDTIMVVRIDPGTSQAAVLPLPRDLLVPIAGTGEEGRINGALAGGPTRLVATVEALGVPVDRYVGVDFDGMRAIVEAVGGIDVHVPAPIRDRASGLQIDGAGCVELDGDTALALARSRRLEQYVGGRWQMDPRSDLGRIERQVLMGRLMLATFREVGGRPAELERLTRVFAAHATIDAGLSNRELIELARMVHKIEPQSVYEMALPVTERVQASGAAVLELTGDREAQIEVMDGTADDEFGERAGAAAVPADGPPVGPVIAPC